MGAHNDVSVARVRLVNGKEVILPITSEDKPVVSEEVMGKWQSTVNLVAKVLEVPTGLITRIRPESLDIFLASETEGNFFEKGASLPLGIGMYCETTTGTQHAVHVPHAQEDVDWKDNPSVEFGLVSYLGMPLIWPDGELFGTFCMLDTRLHRHSDMHQDVLAHFRRAIETDLSMLMDREELRRLNKEKDMALREAHHRIKNHLNMMLSLIQLRSTDCTVSPETMQAFIRDVSGRLATIAQLHSQLANAEGSDVDVGGYVRQVAEAIVASVSQKEVDISFDVDQVRVSRETFLDSGLLVSELVTNSLKHAFEGVSNPKITIRIKDQEGPFFLLEYQDNGVGLSEADNCRKGVNLGLLLTESLTKKMGGSYDLKAEGGFCYASSLQKGVVR